ncbi:MAG: SPOR domain-containing protein, partial [Burkholderiales bacterium]|nr:SPOR domain-containing protein [Burkholderiales bacterium]
AAPAQNAAPAATATPAPEAPAPTAAASTPARNPAAILAGAPSTAAAPAAFIYYVQVGAFTRTEEAEQQRARLALVGYSGKVSEREQSGHTVYRVRVGPYDTRAEAESVQQGLQASSIEARLVRVEKP